jgi:hypothetical protein
MTTTKQAADKWYEPRTRIENPAPQDYQQWGNELIRSFLMAGGLAAGGSALYNLATGFNESQLPELLRDEAPAVVTKPPKKRAVKKKYASEKQATQLAEFLGRSIPQGVFPDVSLPGGGAPAHPVTSATHESWRQLYNIAAAGLGGYAGLSLVGSLAQSKKKEDLEDQVETARQEYFDALQGKDAAALDALYEKTCATKTAAPEPESNWLDDTLNTVRGALGTAGGAGYRLGQEALTTLHLATLASSLGAGGLGAIYMYNRTKDRTRAENLQLARRAKMRLQDIQQRPWIDPTQLAQTVHG